jgi:GR25 family glycosyltransferase involved in LPS biosynthesis
MNYVISLKRTPERLERFLNINQHMDFQIFDAVDGKDLEPINSFNQYAHGVALSHVELWKKCAAGTEDFLICEDDAEIHKDLQRAIDGLKAANHPYDFIAWGWNMDGEVFAGTLPELTPVCMTFSNKHAIENKQTYLNTPVDPVFMRLYYYFGTCCYTISPAGAQQFLDILYPFQKTITVDVPGVTCYSYDSVGIDCSMAAAFAKTLSVLCFPPLAVTENNKKESTVQVQD